VVIQVDDRDIAVLAGPKAAAEASRVAGIYRHYGVPGLVRQVGEHLRRPGQESELRWDAIGASQCDRGLGGPVEVPRPFNTASAAQQPSGGAAPAGATPAAGASGAGAPPAGAPQK